MKFPEKLWTLVNECKSGAICWGTEGKTVVVNYIKFEDEFLGENSVIFKTKNIISFIRQLNLYGFRKCNRFMDVHEFKNPYFVRGRKDLLKNMRRKLGYTLYNVPANEKIKKGSSKISNEKDDIILNDIRESPKHASTASTDVSSNISYPFPPLQDLNSLPSGWWGNAYDPLNLVYPTHPVHQLQNESNASLDVKEEKVDITEKRDDNLPWGNLGLYRNIVFVPVPAQYGMYPGFFNGNLTMPYFMPQQDEITNRSTTE